MKKRCEVTARRSETVTATVLLASLLVMFSPEGASTISYASLRVKFACAALISGRLTMVLALTLERMPRFLPKWKQMIATATQARIEEDVATPIIVIIET